METFDTSLNPWGGVPREVGERMRRGVTREGGERMRHLAGDDDSQDRPWFFRRTSSAPELDGRVRAGANLSKREWRPAAQRDILAQHFYDSNFKFDLACKPEVASSISLRNKSGGAQRHEAAKSSSVSLPPSPLLPPERAYWQCSSGSSSSYSSYPSSSCSSYPSPACNFSVYDGGNWMREGAQSPLSDISDMEDDNPLERARSGDEEESRPRAMPLNTERCTLGEVTGAGQTAC